MEKINIHHLMERFQSKKELHTFLIQDCQAFIPKQESTNVYFLKAIIHGKKDVIYVLLLTLVQYLKRSEIKVSSVPQIEGLTAHDFLDYAKTKPSLLTYLPDEQDWLHLDKKWICDVLFTLDQAGVQEMIDTALKQRREKFEAQQHDIIEMRPEFAKALEHCQNFSHHHGKSAFLLKDSSKRKRKLSEIESVKLQEDQLKQDKQGFLLEAKRMSEQNKELKELLATMMKQNKKAKPNDFEKEINEGDEEDKMDYQH